MLKWDNKQKFVSTAQRIKPLWSVTINADTLIRVDFYDDEIFVVDILSGKHRSITLSSLDWTVSFMDFIKNAHILLQETT